MNVAVPRDQPTAGFDLTALDRYTTFSDRLFDVLAVGGGEVDYWAGHHAADRVRLSFDELARDARGLAVQLTREGHAPGDVAVLAFEPGLDFVRALLAALHAGLVIAPIPLPTGDSGHAVHRLEQICADAGSGIVLCDSAGAAAAADASLPGIAVWAVPEFGAGHVADAGSWERPGADPDALIVLQYTSGSTGAPKGVEITQGNLIASQVAIAQAVSSGPGVKIVGWLPHFHDMGLIGMILHPFAAAGSLVFTTPSQFLRRPLLWLRMLSETRADITVAPDFGYELVARRVKPHQIEDFDLSHVRVAVTGSEPVRTSTLDAFLALTGPVGFPRAAFRPSYGMAETTLLVSGYEPEGRYRVKRAEGAALGAGVLQDAVGDDDVVDIVSCGLPAIGADVRIVDPESGIGREHGEIGEIWVNAPFVARGYRNLPPDDSDFGAQIGAVAYYRTGDLGALVDGRLFVTGRLKDLLIIRGRNVYPHDIEDAVVAAAGANGTGIAAAFECGDRLVVVVEVTTRAAQNPAPLIADLAGNVAGFLGTSADVVLVRRGAIPRTTSGKVRRRETREMLAAGALERIEAGAGTDREGTA